MIIKVRKPIFHFLIKLFPFFHSICSELKMADGGCVVREKSGGYENTQF